MSIRQRTGARAYAIALAAVGLLAAAPALLADVRSDVEQQIRQETAGFVPLPVPRAQPRTGPRKLYSSLIGSNETNGPLRVIPRFTARPMPPRDGLPGVLDGVSGRPNAGGTGFLNFGGLSQVGDPTTWPSRGNVKLFLKFSSGNYVASGILIDPRTVLTAGHCLFDHEHGSGWVQSITAVPAYENGDRPFGYAKMVGKWTWTGWTEDQDYDWDMGVIILDRPVGGWTGWYGFGYDDDDDFFDGRTFYNGSYPGEGGYSGEYMYSRQGTWDDIDGDELCMNRVSYGGMSGSGYFTLLNTSRIVYGVHSHTHTSSATSCGTRINGSRFYDIRDGFIDGATPSTPDLVPMNVNISASQVTAGGKVGVGVLIHNYSHSAWSGTIPIQMRLSSNAAISTGDLLLKTQNWTGSIGPKQTVKLTLSQPTIPTNLSGSYWVGVTLGVSDANNGNNASNNLNGAETYNWDADALTVKPNYDTTVSVSGLSGTQGTIVALKATLKRVSDKTALGSRWLTFKVDGGVVGSAMTDASGIATVNYTIPGNASAGNHSVAVSFAGDSTYHASSGTGSLKVYIRTSLTVPGVSATLYPAPLSQIVSLKATLRRTDTNTPLAGKTVSFYIGPAFSNGTYMGQATTDANGEASRFYVVGGGFGVGTWTITAKYAGDSTYAKVVGIGLLTIHSP